MFLTPEHLVEKLYIKPGATVADFGAGSGAYTMALLHAVSDTGKVYAVDLHRDMLTTLKNTAEKMGYFNLETVWANIESSTYIGDLCVEALVFSNVLFQLEFPEKAIEEASRIVIPGGVVLCVDWSASHGGVGPHPSHVVTEARAESLFLRSGFKIGERLPAGKYHYAFIAIKL